MRVAPTTTGGLLHGARPTWSSWLLGIGTGATGSLKTRCTTARAARYFEYTAKTSNWRHVAVITAAPMLGLLAALVPPCIPAQPPSAGLAKNVGFCVHFFVILTVTMMGAMFQARTAASINHDEYSNLDIAAAACIGSAHVVGVIALMGYCWRFPVPFTWIMAEVPWFVFLFWGNILILRSRLVHPHTLGKRHLSFMPSLLVQLLQMVIYPVFSTEFEACGSTGQYALILLFPFVKMILKRAIYAISRHLTEFAKEVSVSSVKIASSMYQSMVMQTASSLTTTALVISLDVCQGLFELRMFVDHESSVPNAEILTRANSML